MKLGMVGLGKMGGNMAERLRAQGHEVVGYDAFSAATEVASLEDLVAALAAPRVVWVMVPVRRAHRGHGHASWRASSSRATSIIDGGNSNWRGQRPPGGRGSPTLGIGFIDAGTSGGVWGRTEGYCLMVGGAAERRRRRAAGLRRAGARRAASSTSARPAPATSRRWCTTASSTG